MSYHITLKPLYHKGRENIALIYPRNPALEKEVRKIKGIKYTRTYRCWYTALSKEDYLAIKNCLETIAVLDLTELRNYLQQRKSVRSLVKTEKLSRARALALLEFPLNDYNLNAFLSFQHMIQLKGYSPRTLKTYSNEFHCLLRLLGRVNVSDLSKQHVQSYLLWLMKKKGYSETHVHTAINAIKFYFEKEEGRTREFYDLPRPKKPLRLPEILAEEEVVSLLKGMDNLKHQAVLMTAYSAGLRVSELVNLRKGIFV